MLAFLSFASQHLPLTHGTLAQQDQHQSLNTSKFVLQHSPNSAEHHSQHTPSSISTDSAVETTSGVTQELGTPLQHSPHQHCHSSHLPGTQECVH